MNREDLTLALDGLQQQLVELRWKLAQRWLVAETRLCLVRDGYLLHWSRPDGCHWRPSFVVLDQDLPCWAVGRGGAR